MPVLIQAIVADLVAPRRRALYLAVVDATYAVARWLPARLAGLGCAALAGLLRLPGVRARSQR